VLPFVLDREEESNCHCGETVLWRIRFILVLKIIVHFLICGLLTHLSYFQMNEMCYNL